MWSNETEEKLSGRRRKKKVTSLKVKYVGADVKAWQRTCAH